MTQDETIGTGGVVPTTGTEGVRPTTGITVRSPSHTIVAPSSGTVVVWYGVLGAGNPR
jgi:hypothetical protein